MIDEWDEQEEFEWDQDKVYALCELIEGLHDYVDMQLDLGSENYESVLEYIKDVIVTQYEEITGVNISLEGGTKWIDS